MKAYGWGLRNAGWACLLLVALLLQAAHAAPSAGLVLNAEQTAWIDQHKDKTFTVGFDPFGGVDSFTLRGQRHGFLHLLLANIQKSTGLRLVPAASADWEDAYTRFTENKIDVLYGANPTPEREKLMRFTAPAQRYPYVVLATKDGPVQTLGDLDGKRLGVIANDFVLDALPRLYPNVHFKPVVFADQNLALAALTQGSLDAFVTSGGGVEVEYLVGYP